MVQDMGKEERCAYSKVECDLRALLFSVSVEASFLVGGELVRESSRRYEGIDTGQKAA